MTGELKEILKVIDEAPKRFESQIPDIEKKIFRDVSLLLKDLKTNANGKIQSSIGNLRLINEIKAKLGKIAVSKQYASLVREFVSNIPAINNYQTGIKGIPADSRKMMTAVAKVQIDNTLESLAGSGYKQAVVSKLYDTLLTNVTSGGSYAEMIETLQKQLVTTKESPGLLSKYAKTYVVDTLGEFAGQGNKMVADALKSEWFQYVGSNLTTTREFCEHLTKKRYVHISEIPDLLKGKIDGHQCKLNEKTGLPLGMKEDTNVDNFIEHRGGWNCRHELIPVSDLTVPKEIRERVKRNLFLQSIQTNNISDKGIIETSYPKITGKVVDIENRIRKNADFETGVAFDKDGNIVIDKRGEKKRVGFTPEECKVMKDCVFTHNHPLGWGAKDGTLGRIGNSFSIEDISLAVGSDLSEIRAVTPTFTFSMKRPQNGWGISVTTLEKDFFRAHMEMRNKMNAMIGKATTQKEEQRAIEFAMASHFHLIWKELAKKYGFEYKKTKSVQ